MSILTSKDLLTGKINSQPNLFLIYNQLSNTLATILQRKTQTSSLIRYTALEEIMQELIFFELSTSQYIHDLFFDAVKRKMTCTRTEKYAYKAGKLMFSHVSIFETTGCQIAAIYYFLIRILFFRPRPNIFIFCRYFG